MTDIPFLKQSPLCYQLIKTIKMAKKTFSEMKKTHKDCVGQITPIIGLDNSAQLVLESFFEKVDNKIYEIDQGLIWKNLQYLVTHNNHEIYYHLRRYDEEIIFFFEELNEILKDFEDYKSKFNWKISLASIRYFSNTKKYYERSIKDFSIFIKKNCTYKEIRTY